LPIIISIKPAKTINKTKLTYNCQVSPEPAKSLENVSINQPSKFSPFVRICLTAEIFIARVKSVDNNIVVGSNENSDAFFEYITIIKIIIAKSRFNPINMSTAITGNGTTINKIIKMNENAGYDILIIPKIFFTINFSS